ARSKLPNFENPEERMLLASALNARGAEVIIPLHGRQRVMGWLFLGKRATGAAYSDADLEELATLAEGVSLTVESALLHEQVTVRKALAETLLDSVPVGIVGIGEDNQIRWFNRTAEFLLSLPTSEVLHKSAAKLTSWLQDALIRAARGEQAPEPFEWTNSTTGRVFSVARRPLVSDGKNLGAVAILYDLTHERQLREEHKRAENAVFWTELAAALAHVVRNPLVTISTFAQLLPERYQDEQFRTEFAKLALDEIHRLNSLIDELYRFANPPELSLEPLDIAPLLCEAQQLAASRVPAKGIKMTLQVEPGLPAIRGDRKSLLECFVHLIANAVEAYLRTGSDPGAEEHVVELSARRRMVQNGEVQGIIVTIRDKAGGIPDAIRDKVLSPFVTTKPRGIGLGLPLVSRTVADHKGTFHIEPDREGTTITVTLPSESAAAGGAR
ncbi:MAG: two-component system sensor histidine kinase NtrB, partial [Kiritimatiellia bacterium]